MRQEQLEDRPHQMHETHEKHRVTLTHGSGNSKENVGFSEVKKKKGTIEMMGFTSLTKEEIIASSVGNINTIGYLILRCLLCLLKKKTYERSAYIIGTCICISSHAFLVFAFCLADPCPSPITSRFLPFLCKMTKLPHVTCHSFPSIYYIIHYQ